MKALFLARHGEAGSNEAGTVSGTPPGAPLTAAGSVQARRLAAALAEVEVDLGVVTEFVRTQQTIEIALAGRHVPRLVLAELNEIRFGGFDGGPLDAYRAWAWSTEPDVRPPENGESRAEVAARVAQGLDMLAARDEETILVVGHALPVRYVIDAAAGRFPAAKIDQVPHASLHRLAADAVKRAAELLLVWSEQPAFRDFPG